MGDTYSLYDAKAKLSEIVRRVREGRTITLTYRGTPVAEVRPIEKPTGGLEEHLQELIRRGVIIPAKNPGAPMKAIAHRPGALKRFLRDRSRF